MNKPTASIENGKFTFTTPDGLVFREETTKSSNIREASYFAETKFSNPVEIATKNGLTQAEANNALYVLVWPTKGGGCGQYITIRESSARFLEVKALKAARLEAEKKEAEAKANEITITLSSRGWGDYSPLVWIGDKNTPTEQILTECKELLATGEDVDQPNQTDAELIGKIEVAKGSEKKKIAAKIETLEKTISEKSGQDLVATEADARAAEKRYNDLHNEGGEGYVPEIWSAQRLAAAKDRLADLKAKLAAL